MSTRILKVAKKRQDSVPLVSGSENYFLKNPLTLKNIRDRARRESEREHECGGRRRGRGLGIGSERATRGKGCLAEQLLVLPVGELKF